jgi:hypothetical protein
MKTADKYRRYAKECLELARTFREPQARGALLHMAQVWLRLANDLGRADKEDASVAD